MSDAVHFNVSAIYDPPKRSNCSKAHYCKQHFYQQSRRSATEVRAIVLRELRQGKDTRTCADNLPPREQDDWDSQDS